LVGVKGMANCPRCQAKAKPTGKEWEYGQFHVKQFECLGCEKKYMEYYKDGKLSHTIPKPKPKSQGLELLK
jgi:transposase-like protein